MDGERRVALVETKTVDTQHPTPNTQHLIRYQFGNHLGSASVELDDRAQVISYEEYYPYGSTSYQAVRSDIEVSPKRYRYTGKERDEESGFNYHGARYYAPWLGRWTAVDPIAIAAQGRADWDVYTYASCRPAGVNDPTGTDSNETVFHLLTYLFGSSAKPLTAADVQAEHRARQLAQERPAETARVEKSKPAEATPAEPPPPTDLEVLQHELESWNGLGSVVTQNQARWTAAVFLTSTAALREKGIPIESASLLTAVAAEEVMHGATKAEKGSKASPNVPINNIFSLQFEGTQESGPQVTQRNLSPEDYEAFGVKSGKEGWMYEPRGKTSDIEIARGAKQDSPPVWNPIFPSIKEAVRAQVALPFSVQGWSGVNAMLRAPTTTARALGTKLGMIGYGAHSGESLAGVHRNVVSVLKAFAKRLDERIMELDVKSAEKKQLEGARSWLGQQIQVATGKTG